MSKRQFNRIYKQFIERTNNMKEPIYRFEICRSHTLRDKLLFQPAQYYARIVSNVNGRVIFNTERYKNELDCMDIARSVRNNAIESKISKTYQPCV